MRSFISTKNSKIITLPATTCNFTPKVTITYSGYLPPTNKVLIYTNAKPAHPYMTSSSNYNPGSKWVTLDQKSSQATHSMFETCKKKKKKHFRNVSLKTISPQIQAMKVQKRFLLRTKCKVLPFSVVSILDDAIVSISQFR